MPLIIGVAGAIATGKSSACKILEKLGATHCDADKLVHTLYEPGKPAFDRIIETFGDEVVGDRHRGVGARGLVAVDRVGEPGGGRQIADEPVSLVGRLRLLTGRPVNSHVKKI